MKAPKKAKPAELPESNPFVDGFIEYVESPEGELSMEAMDLVVESLEGVQVDAKARKLLWEDGQRLSIDASVQRIHADHTSVPGRIDRGAAYLMARRNLCARRCHPTAAG